MDIALLDPDAEPAVTAWATPVGWLAKEIACRSSPRTMLVQCMTHALEAFAVRSVPAASTAAKRSPLADAIGPVSAAVALKRILQGLETFNNLIRP